MDFSRVHSKGLEVTRSYDHEPLYMYRTKWLISLPFNILQLEKSPPFLYLKRKKGTPFHVPLPLNYSSKKLNEFILIWLVRSVLHQTL